MNGSNDLGISLHRTQSLVFQSEASEILFGGAAGGGKSFLSRVMAIMWAMWIPGLQVYFFRRQFVDIELNHLNGPKSFPALLAAQINSGHVTYNKTKYQFTFWNGSVIRLCHVQKTDDMYNYLGAEIHLLIIDELSQFTPTIYRFLRSRLRMIGVNVPEWIRKQTRFPKIICCSNPGGSCHSFMKMNWVKAAPELKVWKAKDEDGGMYRQFIPSKIMDNPSLMDEDPDYVNRLKGLGDPVLVKAYLEGSFDIISGGMFDDIYSPAYHLLKPFKIPSTWQMDRSFDWGSSKPFNVSWFAEADGREVTLADGTTKIFPKGSLIQFGEWYGWNGKPNEGIRLTPTSVAKGIISIDNLIGRAVLPGPADPNIYNLNELNTSIADYMEREHVYWSKADNSPGSRPAGLIAIRIGLENSVQNNGKPGLYFFDNCVHMQRTISEAVRGVNNPEDLEKGTEDHAIDTLRYRIQNGIMKFERSRIRAF